MPVSKSLFVVNINFVRHHTIYPERKDGDEVERMVTAKLSTFVNRYNWKKDIQINTRSMQLVYSSFTITNY